MMTQHSSKSRVRSNTFHSKPSSQDGGSQHSAAHFILQQQLIPNPQQPSPESFQQMLATTQHQIRAPPAAAIITPPGTQIISTAGFIEPQQYLAAIPVQPVAGFAPDVSASVLSPIPPTSPVAFAVHPNVSTAAGGVVLTPTQNQVQDQLHRKHEELQHLIIHQQEELRRVQEQLLMARYGLLPSIVTIPFTSASSSTVDMSSRSSSSTSYLQHHQSPYSSHQYPTHPSLANQQQNLLTTQQHQHQQQPDQQMSIPPDQKPIFHSNQQLNFTDTGQPKLPGDPGNDMVSYMQLTPVPIHHLQQQSQPSQQQQQQQHQQMQNPEMNLPGPSGSGGMELLQYQMAEEQAQTLFTSGMEQQQQQQQHLPQSQQQQHHQHQQMHSHHHHHHQHQHQHHHHQQQQQQQHQQQQQQLHHHHQSQHHHSQSSSLGSPSGSNRSHSRSDM